MNKIKIAYIIPSLEIGGSEQKVIDLATNLNLEKFTPHIILISKGGALLEKAEANQIQTFIAKKQSKVGLIALFRIKKYLKENKIDIVQVFTSTGKLWGRLAAILAHTKIIVSTEESLFRGKKLDVWLEKRFASKTNIIITNSLATKTSAQKYTLFPDSRYQIIYNGIDLDKFKVLKKANETHPFRENDETILMCVARFDPRKGIHTLIEAVSLLKKDKYRFKLILVGDGSLKLELKNLTDRLQLNKEVLFVGYRNDIPAILRTADIFVLPSLEEGFGNVVVEAMASSVPVIASNIGGLSEIINDEKNGLLFETQNSQSLYEKIKKLIDDPLLREHYQKQAFIDAKKFSLKHMVQAHEILYLDLLKEVGYDD